MKLHQDLGGQAIQDVLKVHPQIGSILEKFDSGSVSGRVGSQVCSVEKATPVNQDSGRIESELRQWPTQLHLVPPRAPWLQGAHLLIAADCTPFAYAEFHRDFIKGRVLVNACPKLDDTSNYVNKLTEILQQNDIQSVMITIMEVPCCRGMGIMAEQAVEASGKDIPFEIAIIGVAGERVA